MRTNIATPLAAVLCLALSGCVMLAPGGKARVDLTPTSKPQYATVFDQAVKACRDLDLPVNLANRDVGQIQCGLKSSEVEFFRVGYSVDTLIERDTDQSAKNVSVKVESRTAAHGTVATDSDANALAQRFLAILQAAGVK